jgi:hypothetical protein
MRQHERLSREAVRSQITHIVLLGPARRARGRVLAELNGRSAPPAFIQAHRLFRLRPAVPKCFDQGTRFSSYRHGSDGGRRPADTAPPVVHAFTVAEVVPETYRTDFRPAPTHIAEPSVLVAQASGTARVLAALMGEAAGTAVGRDVSEPHSFDTDSPANPSVLGPKPGLDLEFRASEGSGSLWDDVGTSDDSDATETVYEQTDGFGGPARYGYGMDDRTVEQEHRSGEVRLAPTELREQWMGEVTGSLCWPDGSVGFSEIPASTPETGPELTAQETFVVVEDRLPETPGVSEGEESSTVGQVIQGNGQRSLMEADATTDEPGEGQAPCPPALADESSCLSVSVDVASSPPVLAADGSDAAALVAEGSGPPALADETSSQAPVGDGPPAPHADSPEETVTRSPEQAVEVVARGAQTSPDLQASPTLSAPRSEQASPPARDEKQDDKKEGIPVIRRILIQTPFAESAGHDPTEPSIRQPKNENFMRRRQELLRKALAQRLETSSKAQGTDSRPRRVISSPKRLSWKPGDPYAGWSRGHVNRFRWSAMFLTAGGVAGGGYLALRLLLAAGLI